MFLVRVVGDRVGHHHPGFVQPDPAHRAAFLSDTAAERRGALVQGRERGTLADEGAELGHLGDDHGDDLHAVDFVVGEQPGLFRLDHDDAEGFAKTLDRHAEEGREDLLAGLGHEAEALFTRRVGGVDRALGAGHAADETLADAHPGVMDCLGVQALGGAQLQGFGIAEQVDRADPDAHAIGNDGRDPVKPFLTGRILGKRGA